MSQITATLSQYRQSPRKVRLLADLVRGKGVSDALTTLKFTTKRASHPIYKLISSAVANAKAQSIDIDTLVVSSIEVNDGAIMYRRQPAARGSAHPIRKRTSHVTVALDVASGAKGNKVVSKNKKKSKE
jgi:large subunit ribosomal protein L22